MYVIYKHLLDWFKHSLYVCMYVEEFKILHRRTRANATEAQRYLATTASAIHTYTHTNHIYIHKACIHTSHTYRLTSKYLTYMVKYI